MNDFTYSLDLHYDINSVKEAEEKLKELADIHTRLADNLSQYKQKQIKQTIFIKSEDNTTRFLCFTQKVDNNLRVVATSRDRATQFEMLLFSKEFIKDEFLRLKEFILSINEDELT